MSFYFTCLSLSLGTTIGSFVISTSAFYYKCLLAGGRKKAASDNWTDFLWLTSPPLTRKQLTQMITQILRTRRPAVTFVAVKTAFYWFILPRWTHLSSNFHDLFIYFYLALFSEHRWLSEHCCIDLTRFFVTRQLRQNKDKTRSRMNWEKSWITQTWKDTYNMFCFHVLLFDVIQSSFLSSWKLGLLSTLTVKIVWQRLPLWL